MRFVIFLFGGGLRCESMLGWTPELGDRHNVPRPAHPAIDLTA